MAKRKADNFIASDDDERSDQSEYDRSTDSEELQKPKSRKKGKVATKSNSNDGEAAAPLSTKFKTVKKPKITSNTEDADDIVIQSTPEGDKYVNLGKKKRATVRTFKGNTLLDIREFYGADGDEKPGKKGISLSIEQWEALKHSTTAINSLFADLKKK